MTYLAVAGNIGVGKTSLVNLLAQHFNWPVAPEPVTDNPYLPDFYHDMKRWAFHSQIYFLQQRFEQTRKITESSQSVIQDRTLYEDQAVFAANLHTSGLISTRDYQNYLALYHQLERLVQPPDLLIYIKASVPVLQKRIDKRRKQQKERHYEQQIPENYLQQLNNKYEEWVSQYDKSPVITLNGNEIDFINRPEHTRCTIQQIASAIGH